MHDVLYDWHISLVKLVPVILTHVEAVIVTQVFVVGTVSQRHSFPEVLYVQSVSVVPYPSHVLANLQALLSLLVAHVES